MLILLARTVLLHLIRFPAREDRIWLDHLLAGNKLGHDGRRHRSPVGAVVSSPAITAGVGSTKTGQSGAILFRRQQDDAVLILPAIFVTDPTPVSADVTAEGSVGSLPGCEKRVHGTRGCDHLAKREPYTHTAVRKPASFRVRTVRRSRFQFLERGSKRV